MDLFLLRQSQDLPPTPAPPPIVKNDIPRCQDKQPKWTCVCKALLFVKEFKMTASTLPLSAMTELSLILWSSLYQLSPLSLCLINTVCILRSMQCTLTKRAVRKQISKAKISVDYKGCLLAYENHLPRHPRDRKTLILFPDYCREMLLLFHMCVSLSMYYPVTMAS